MSIVFVLFAPSTTLTASAAPLVTSTNHSTLKESFSTITDAITVKSFSSFAASSPKPLLYIEKTYSIALSRLLGPAGVEPVSVSVLLSLLLPQATKVIQPRHTSTTKRSVSSLFITSLLVNFIN